MCPDRIARVRQVREELLVVTPLFGTSVVSVFLVVYGIKGADACNALIMSLFIGTLSLWQYLRERREDPRWHQLTEALLHGLAGAPFALQLVQLVKDERPWSRIVVPLNLVAKNLSVLQLVEYKRIYFAEIAVQCVAYAAYLLRTHPGRDHEFPELHWNEFCIASFVLLVHLIVMVGVWARLRWLGQSCVMYGTGRASQGTNAEICPVQLGSSAVPSITSYAGINCHSDGFFHTGVSQPANAGCSVDVVNLWQLRQWGEFGLCTVRPVAENDAMSQSSLESYHSSASIAERLGGVRSVSWTRVRQVLVDATSVIMRARAKSAEMLMWRLGVMRNRPEWLLPAVVLRPKCFRTRLAVVPFAPRPLHGDVVDAIHFTAVMRTGQVLSDADFSWADLPSQARELVAVFLGFVVEADCLVPPRKRSHGALPPV